MSDTTARDQLAQIIYDTLNGQYGDFNMPDDAAEAILDAGWRPPARVVSTWEEVLALKEGALLAIERWGHMRVYERQEDDAWCLSGGGWLDEDWLPATVLYEPKEGE